MVFIDSFSGALSDLKPKSRTVKTAVRVLLKHPRVSTWDMSENPWLVRLVKDLKDTGLVREEDEPYPWHRFTVTDKGRALAAEAG